MTLYGERIITMIHCLLMDFSCSSLIRLPFHCFFYSSLLMSGSQLRSFFLSPFLPLLSLFTIALSFVHFDRPFAFKFPLQFPITLFYQIVAALRCFALQIKNNIFLLCKFHHYIPSRILHPPFLSLSLSTHRVKSRTCS